MLRMNLSSVLGTGTVLPVSCLAMLLISKMGLPDDLHPVTLRASSDSRRNAHFGGCRIKAVHSSCERRKRKR